MSKLKWTIVVGPVLVIVAMAVPVLAAGTVAAAYALEKQPGFCALCHEMQPSYDNWRSSGAAEDHPDCIQCHKGPGLAGVLDAQRRGVRDTVAHVSGNYPRPIVAQVPDAWCTQCHAGAETSGEHDEVPEFNAKACAACHNHAPGADFSGEEEERETEEEEEELDRPWRGNNDG